MITKLLSNSSLNCPNNWPIYFLDIQDFDYLSSNFEENKEGFKFEIDLPGVKKDSIEVSKDGKKVSLKAKRKQTEYKRHFYTSREAENIKAKLEDGVLFIEGNWKESDKPIVIEVEGGS